MNAGTLAVLFWIDVTSGNSGRVSGAINHILYLHFWKTIRRGPPYWRPLYVPSVILTLYSPEEATLQTSERSSMLFLFYSSLFKTFQSSLGFLSCHLPATIIFSTPQCILSRDSYLRNAVHPPYSHLFFFFPQSLQKNLVLFLPLILEGRVPLYVRIHGGVR